MPADFPDKKALWNYVTTRASEDLESGLAFMLMDRCYLDSIENGKAIIGTKTEAVRVQVERKAVTAIQNAITEILGYSVQIAITLGRPRIFEKSCFTETLHYGRNVLGGEKEVEFLHNRYGDIMTIVDKQALFQQVCKPLDKGGWGLFRPVLTNACKDYGIVAVLKGLRETAERSDITKARAAFLSDLKQGKFGGKLPFGANILGL
jgi:hypothetical protein